MQTVLTTTRADGGWTSAGSIFTDRGVRGRDACPGEIGTSKNQSSRSVNVSYLLQLHHENQLVYDFSHIMKHVPCNQKYPCLRQHWPTSQHMAYFSMCWETLTMCWETWCSFDLNTIKFNAQYKHRCEVVKLQCSLIFPKHGEVGLMWWARPVLSQTWILMIARNMFGDVRKVINELVHVM